MKGDNKQCEKEWNKYETVEGKESIATRGKK